MELKFEVGQSADFFIEIFFNAANVNNWTNERKCLKLCCALPKEAQRWYLTLSNTQKENFDELRKAFLFKNGSEKELKCTKREVYQFKAGQ